MGSNLELYLVFIVKKKKKRNLQNLTKLDFIVQSSQYCNVYII